jgi:branched-chain amino acid transport system substrate-binding protein
MLMTLASAIIAGSFLISGCGGGGADDANIIKIGSLQSLTGDTSTFGTSSNKGIELATEQRNKAGGVLGKQIKIISADTQSDVRVTPQAMLKLLQQDKVVAVLGEVASGRTMAASQAALDNHIPLLSPASTNEKVTKAGDYIFRSCYTDGHQGEWVAEYAAAHLGKRAALIYDTNSPYSVGLAERIKDVYPKLGGQIIFETTYAGSNTKDFKTQLTAIREKNPDVIFLPGYYQEITSLVPQARRELGMKDVPFIGGDGWDSEETLKADKESMNHCFFINHYASNDPDPKVQAFVKTFKERFNGETPDAMAVLAYDAANIMFDAISRAGSTEGPKIRDALAATKDFQGVTGVITIDANRNAVKPGVVLEIVNGELVLREHMAPPGVK